MSIDNNLGSLSPEEYRSRRSPTLLNNPHIFLDERFEIERYLSLLDQSYRQEIKTMTQVNTQLLTPNTRLIVTIIAYNEGEKIYKALSNYLKQDLDPKLFEIIIFENHPNSKEKDTTEEEVQRFKEDNPSLSILYAHKVWQEGEAGVGNARKHVFDIALERIYERNVFEQETVIVSNDADTVSIDSNYLSSILEEFDFNKKTDALVTSIVVPFATIQKPNIFGALLLWDALDAEVSNGEPYNLRGASSAFRVSTYSAIGGFNGKSKQTEDLEIGWLIADARDWDPESVILLKKTKSVQDPRRILVAVASRIPVNEMYYDFESKPEIRQANNDALLTLIPDYFDWNLLEEDLDSFWQGRTTGMYKWRGKRFEVDYRNAMRNMGIEYEITNDRIKLKNIDKLVAGFENEFGKQVQVVHSTERPWDQERQDALKRFFWNIADSMIVVRKNIAERVAKDIESTSKNDQATLSDLFARYKRFAGVDYEKSST